MEKKISAPNWKKITREEKNNNLPLPNTQILNQTNQISKDPRKEIKKQIEKMHKDALKQILGLDQPLPDLCQTCYQVMKGDTYILTSGENLYICRKCYQSLPRCNNCGRPVEKPIRGASIQLCKLCRAQKQCVACSVPIQAKYGLRIKGVRGFFCKDCFEADKCFFCGFPAVNGSVDVESGIAVCEHCLDKSILNAEEANKVLIKVLKEIKQNFSIKTNANYKIGVTSISNLNSSGTLNNFVKVIRKNGAIVIIIASGLPIERVQGKLAFEIAKQFIMENLGSVGDINVYFGFGKYIKYNYLNGLGYVEEAKYLKKSEEYKNEFQNFIKLEKKLGFSKIIDTIKKGYMPICV